MKPSSSAPHNEATVQQRRRRSGGPRTEAGRKAASKNALKTGTYAVTVVLPGEDGAKFEELRAQLMRDYAPQDGVTAALVHSLAGYVWKKMRLERIEHSYLQLRQRAQLNDYEIPCAQLGLGREDAREVIHLAMRTTPEEGPSLFASFNLARKFTAGESVPASEFEDFETKHRRLWEVGEAEVASFGIRTRACLRHDWTDQSALPIHKVVGEKFLAEYRMLPFLLLHEPAVRACVHAIQEKRLLEVMKVPDLHRAYDHLDRAIMRTLAALRKHERWRAERTTVITPEQDEEEMCAREVEAQIDAPEAETAEEQAKDAPSEKIPREESAPALVEDRLEEEWQETEPEF